MGVAGPTSTRRVAAIGPGPAEDAAEQLPAVGKGRQEIGPRGGAALGSGVDPGLVQDLPDGGGGDLHSEDQQLAVYPAIPPRWILVTPR
jgi:hypothetical protein